MVDRHLAARYPNLVSQQGIGLEQVELDIGPLLICSSSRASGRGPSPLSSSSSSSPTSSSSSSKSSYPAYVSNLVTHAADMLMQEQQWRPGACSINNKLQQQHMRQKVEDVLWLASACFILFYGDFRSNFFSLLVSDPRIPRMPLLYGMACLLISAILVLLLILNIAAQHPRGLARSLTSSSLKNQDDSINATASNILTLLGLAAFVMLSIALWPVWYILTLPLLFTLFMAAAVVVSYALPSWSRLFVREPQL